MILGEGRVGEAKGFKAGAEEPLRLGKSGEVVGSQLHGRYYEQASRGRIFVGRIARTFGGGNEQGLVNPTDSLRRLVPIRYEMAFTTLNGAGVSAWINFNLSLLTPNMAHVLTSQQASIASSIIGLPIGTNNMPSGRIFTAFIFGGGTLTSTPFRQLATVWGAQNLICYAPSFVINFEGACVLDPGSILWSKISGGSGGSEAGQEIWIWQEEDMPSPKPIGNP